MYNITSDQQNLISLLSFLHLVSPICAWLEVYLTVRNTPNVGCYIVAR